MVEETTGLPIGTPYLACKHQRSSTRSASMHLEHLALEFYDANCINCPERLAVRFPNITQLVGRRDAEREAAATAVQYSHYSLLATVEAIFNLGTLGRNDTSATPMSDLFRGGIP